MLQKEKAAEKSWEKLGGGERPRRPTTDDMTMGSAQHLEPLL
jgi:hypothetical protein